MMDEELNSLQKVETGIAEWIEDFLETGEDRQLDVIVSQSEVPGYREITWPGYYFTVSKENFVRLYQDFLQQNPTFMEQENRAQSKGIFEEDDLTTKCEIFSSPVPFLAIRIKKLVRTGELLPPQFSLHLSFNNSEDAKGELPQWLNIKPNDFRETVLHLRDEQDKELQPIISNIKAQASEEKYPRLYWLRREGMSHIVFYVGSEFYGQEEFLPSRQITLNLTPAKVVRLQNLLCARERNYTTSYSQHYWSHTSIPKVYWHYAGWTDACVGADNWFIIMNLPPGEVRDIREVGKKIERLFREIKVPIPISKELDPVISESVRIDDLRKAVELYRTLYEQQKQIAVDIEKIDSFEARIDRIEFDYILNRDIPWHYERNHIGDVQIRLDRLIEIGEKIGADYSPASKYFCNEARRNIAWLEKEKKDGRNSFFRLLFNKKERRERVEEESAKIERWLKAGRCDEDLAERLKKIRHHYHL